MRKPRADLAWGATWIAIRMAITPLALATALYRRPIPLLVLTALFWAGNAVAGQLAIGNVSPFALVFLRWAIVATFMWLIVWREALASWDTLRGHFLTVMAMATAGFTGFNALFYVASHETSAVNIGIIQGAIPMAVLLGAFLVYRAKIAATQIAGVALTVCGVLAVASAGDFSQLLMLRIGLGDALMILAGLLYAIYTVSLRSRPKIPGLVFFTLLSTVALVTSLPLVGWEIAQEQILWPTPSGWLIVGYVALFPSLLSQIFFIRGVELIGPGRAGVYVNLVPVFAPGLAVLVLGEPFYPYHAVALGLVLSGIWLAERRSIG